MLKGVVRWQGTVQFSGNQDEGITSSWDGPESSGGQDAGFRPMELILLGVGGCTSFDVVEILRKAKQTVNACWVELEAERREEVPQVFTRIHMKFLSKVRTLARPVARAISLSAEKYCSASMMLEAGESRCRIALKYWRQANESSTAPHAGDATCGAVCH